MTTPQVATETHDGQLQDYVSGEWIPETPEEEQATQPFSRRLVEEFGYPATHMQTRPQFRVRESPSGQERWPVDIAVFRNENRGYADVYMIAECKRRTRRDGKRQLEAYLNLCNAQIGIWFNGNEHYYCRKVQLPDGGFAFPEIPTLPRFGQSLSDIGRLRRRDLNPPTDLKGIFKDIRNHLAGMTTGITRDEALAREIINLLFCKIYDERNTELDGFVAFHAMEEDGPEAVKARISQLFRERVKGEYAAVFDETDAITLDAESLLYVVGELQNYSVTEATREAIGEAFEVFIGPALRGPEGQFFTPRNVVKMMVDILDPQPGEYVLDPACGSGGFLITALEHVWGRLAEQAERRGWGAEYLGAARRDVANRFFRGIDKDSFLARVTKAYMAIVGDGKGGVFCENSLRRPPDWDSRMLWDEEHQTGLTLGMFDVVVTNPPFGSKIKVEGESLLGQYQLGHSWRYNRTAQQWAQTTSVVESRPPQLLFVERCLQFLKPGGRLGIVLPESIFGNPSHGFVTTYLATNAKFLGIVSMPEDLFQPWTHAKTCIVFLQKAAPDREEDSMFMGVCKWCGHDSRGNPVPYDDVPRIAAKYFATLASAQGPIDRFGFRKRTSEIQHNIYIPKYYDPDIAAELEKLGGTHELVTIRQLMEDGILDIRTGDEVGKLAYGTGGIPFVRTSDIANWEIKIDPKQGVSEQIYHRFARSQRQEVKPGDILMVRDGTYLIGTTAMVTECDGRMLYQSHIYRIRVLKPEALDPYLLLAVLNTTIVKRQVRSKQFTQDIIDTLGARLLEIILPIPKDPALRQEVGAAAQQVVEERARLKQKAKEVTMLVVGRQLTVEEIELAEIV